MINTHDNEWIPSEGYEYISNGEVWAHSIILGEADDISNWHDTNEEPLEQQEEMENDIPDIFAVVGRILMGVE